MQFYPSETELERFADLVVHAVSLLGVVAATIALLILSGLHTDYAVFAACGIYCLTLIFSLFSSAGYHLVPWHSWRPLWRRLDHAAIYALIAGTFTPFLVMSGTMWSIIVLAAVWLLALPAMVFKFLAKELEPRWSLPSYLGLGWLGAVAMPEFGAAMPFEAIVLMVIGGLVYTGGTYFYARAVQPYRYAIWHGFVLVGTSSFFAAICITTLSGTAQA